MDASSPTNKVIRNPDDPQHFMILEPVDGLARAWFGDRTIAESRQALRIREQGRSQLHPVLYFPAGALRAELERVARNSHCPLKGTASHFALDGQEVGWSYEYPFDFSERLKGHFAFWPDKVRMEVRS